MSQSSDAPREDSPFWRFSLRFYARTKVSAACLALQDEAGADVNLLLFLLFLAEHQRQVSVEAVATLDAEVLGPGASMGKTLRELRRARETAIRDTYGTVIGN